MLRASETAGEEAGMLSRAIRVSLSQRRVSRESRGGVPELEFIDQLRGSLEQEDRRALKYVLMQGDVNKHESLAAGIASEMEEELGGTRSVRGRRVCSIPLREEHEAELLGAEQWALGQWIHSPSPHRYSQWKAAAWASYLCTRTDFLLQNVTHEVDAWVPGTINVSLIDETMSLFKGVYSAQYFDPIDAELAPSQMASETVTKVYDDNPEESQGILRWTTDSYHTIEPVEGDSAQQVAYRMGRLMLRATASRRRVATLHTIYDDDVQNPFDGKQKPTLDRLGEGDWLVHAGEVWEVKTTPLLERM